MREPLRHNFRDTSTIKLLQDGAKLAHHLDTSRSSRAQCGSRLLQYSTLASHARWSTNLRTVPDAPLTVLGKKQAAALAPQVRELAKDVDLVVSSPLKRTLQTTKLGWTDAIDRLGGLSKVVCLPQAQECNDYPCDTGSSKAVLEADPEFAELDFSLLTPDWTSKKGFWGADPTSIRKRAQWVRQWLRDRPEQTIVLVAHGDILRQLTCSKTGPSGYMWRNAEAMQYEFDPDTLDNLCLFKSEKGKSVAVAGGYGPSSTEADILTDGKL